MQRERKIRAGAWLTGLFFAAAAALFAAAALDRVSADSLRTNITWLAADQREGRMTPSPGLDASADYLGAQFRLAGLEPGGSDGTYFQPAAFIEAEFARNFRMTLDAGSRHARVGIDSVTVHSLVALNYRDEPVVRLPRRSDPLPAIAGKVVEAGEEYANQSALESLEVRKPALIILTVKGPRPGEEMPVLRYSDVSNKPVVRVYSTAATDLMAAENDVTLTLHAVAPPRNVVGILSGSDPSARDQFVIVSAHYDHLGVKPPGPGNRIFHGANDNASGAASLVEIAKALGAGVHPRRSILFLAVFGEEEGLLGSAYYVRHPLVPIAHTIADINLEQLGRTDSSDGPEIDRFAFTGPAYSNLPQIMSAAAKSAGVEVYRKDTADGYFNRSDNYSFAQAGIVAHTLVVAFEFPDYHEVSDEAGKIDYVNLVKVDRGIAAGVEAVANAAAAPKWSDARAARPYREASR